MRHRPASRSGLTLLELLIGLAVLVVLGAILIPSLGSARKSARIAICGSNLRQLSTGTMSYAADFRDRFAVFTWSASRDKPLKLSEWEDLNGAVTPIEAAAAQALDILRRRTGRVELDGRIELEFPRSWQPYLRHHPLVMLDYLASRLPEKILACPEDKPLIAWQNNIAGFDTNAFAPFQPTPDAAGKLAPYGTTYMPTMSIFDVSPEGSRLTQGERSSELVAPGGEAAEKSDFAGGRLSKVMTPSNKVLFHHEYGLHEAREIAHFGLDQSRQPFVFMDGSVQHLGSIDAHAGWQPNNSKDPAPTSFFTDAFAWNPPTLASNRAGQDPPDRVIGKFRWTREGLAGIDFGRREPGLPEGVEPRGVRK